MSFYQILILVYALLLFAFILYGAHRYISDKFGFRLPPGPVPIPFIGTAHWISSDPRKKPWKSFKALGDRYGPIYTFYFGQMRMIMINGADLIRKTFVSQSKHYSYRADRIMPGFGDNYVYGVVSSDSDRWVNLRRFCMKGLREFGLMGRSAVVRVHEEAAALIHELNQRSGTVDKDFEKLITNAVSNIICATVFGQRFAYDDAKFRELLHFVTVFFERPFKENAIYFAFPIAAKFDVPPETEDCLAIEKVVASLLNQIIADPQRKSTFDPDNPRDFIELWWKNNQDYEKDPRPENKITFEDFAACVRDLFMAGTETTANSLNWTVLYFCKWPEVQRKCQEAVDRVIQTDRLPSLEDRPALVYIDAVMNEIFRHVTIAPTALLHASRGEVTELEGFQIPPDSALNYNIWGVHHDVEYWKDPEEFRPERWIDPSDGSLLTHSSHFMPFGVGPRMCLGDQLARLEYFIFLVAMVQRFTFAFPTPDYDCDIEMGRTGMTHVPPHFDLSIKRR